MFLLAKCAIPKNTLYRLNLQIQRSNYIMYTYFERKVPNIIDLKNMEILFVEWNRYGKIYTNVKEILYILDFFLKSRNFINLGSGKSLIDANLIFKKNIIWLFFIS